MDSCIASCRIKAEKEKAKELLLGKIEEACT
jgi:hypothetical protein